MTVGLWCTTRLSLGPKDFHNIHRRHQRRLWYAPRSTPQLHRRYADVRRKHTVWSTQCHFASVRVYRRRCWLVPLTATGAEWYQDRTHVVRYIILVARSVALFEKLLAVGVVNVQPVESVRNLGVYFDSEARKPTLARLHWFAFFSSAPDWSFTRPRRHIQSSRCITFSRLD